MERYLFVAQRLTAMVLAPLVLGLTLSMMVLACWWGSRIACVLLANRVAYGLGLVSYSLYLWHFVVMQQLPVLFGEDYVQMAGPVKFLVTTFAVIAVSTASYFLFERPFYRLRKAPRDKSQA